MRGGNIVWEPCQKSQIITLFFIRIVVKNLYQFSWYNVQVIQFLVRFYPKFPVSLDSVGGCLILYSKRCIFYVFLYPQWATRCFDQTIYSKSPSDTTSQPVEPNPFLALFVSLSFSTSLTSRALIFSNKICVQSHPLF